MSARLVTARLITARLLLASLLLFAGPTLGADWLSLQGTEPEGEAGKLRLWGFVQTSYEGYVADAVTGLDGPLAAHEGRVSSVNHVWGPSRLAFRVNRARVAIRGHLPGTEGRVSTFNALEVGQNGLTAGPNGYQPNLVDASIALHAPEHGLHLRLGKFKTPLADESMEAVFLTAATIRFSVVTARLLMERPTGPDRTLTGPVSGFRDVGAQLFGVHDLGPTQLSWAAFVSNGTPGLTDEDERKDLTGRLQLSWLPGKRRPARREEISGWIYGQTGHRRVEADHVTRRTRLGAGAHLRLAGWRARIEGVYANGMIFTGRKPPFAGGALSFDPDADAWGLTALLTYRIQGIYEVGVMAAHLDQDPDGGPDRRVFDEATFLLRWHPARAFTAALNVTLRRAEAPDGAPADVQTVLDSMGPYVGLEITAREF